MFGSLTNFEGSLFDDFRRMQHEMEEMYGEPFGVPEPLETVFISWFQGGEVFRSGVCYHRGKGKLFYFRPGHETYPIYFDATVKHIVKNGGKGAATTSLPPSISR